jgi:hypothetical protein
MILLIWTGLSLSRKYTPLSCRLLQKRRPMGIGAFYKSYWDTIKMDMMGAIREMFALRAGCWNLLNSANVVLIPKKKDHKLFQTSG